MTTKILYPILVIIFSLLVIYGILVIRKNNILNNKLENFINFYQNIEKFDSLDGSTLNAQTLNDIVNGNWTTLETVGDDNCNLTNLMEIKSTSASAEDQNGNKAGTFGTISLNNDTFTITYISLENLTARSNSKKSVTITINFNIQLQNQINIAKINQPFFNPDQYNGDLGIYIDSKLINKYAIYKVNGKTANSDLCRIVKSQNVLVEQPPPVYDFATYNVLVNNYIYASNYISVNDWIINNDILNIINTKYFGNIKFSIQRIFYSPTGADNEIITPASIPIVLNCVQNGQIPNNLIITSFSQDQEANSLKAFFKPKGTRLLFYKLTDIKPTYQYGNINSLSTPITALQLQNNSNSLFSQNILFPDVNSVQLLNTNNYKGTFIKSVASDLTSQTMIKFSEIFSLL
jgi:hypothetical protein